MSLIINADDEFLSATGGSFAAAGATGVTMALRVKRDSGSSATQAYAALANSLAAEYDSVVMGHNLSTEDCFTYASGASRRVNGSISTDSTAWQTLILVFKKDVELVVYAGIDGGTLYSHNHGSAPSEVFNNALSQLRIGGGVNTFSGWDSRCRIAQVAVWNTGLSSSQAAELFNGGTAGAGKNPQAVQAANLKFYAPLTSDATVTIGGVTLSATGTITYDGADNPNVEAYGGGSTSYTLTVDSGTYSLSGASLATPISVLMATGAGTYSVTGQDITFGGSSVYTLSLEAGAYNITSETPVIGISMGLDAGSYSIVGQDVTLSSTSGGGTVYSLSIEAGTYTTTGQDLSLIVAYLASLDAGTYDVTGKNVRLVSSTEPVIISSGNHTISVSIKIGI